VIFDFLACFFFFVCRDGGAWEGSGKRGRGVMVGRIGKRSWVSWEGVGWVGWGLG
jgi:hypothetical protein